MKKIFSALKKRIRWTVLVATAFTALNLHSQVLFSEDFEHGTSGWYGVLIMSHLTTAYDSKNPTQGQYLALEDQDSAINYTRIQVTNNVNIEF